MNRKYIVSRAAFDYEISGDMNKASSVILLLHGYGETGKRILDKLSPALPHDALVIAPNGPFPLPFKKEDSYQLVYGWYLYNAKIQEYFIDMSVALDFLLKGLQSIGLPNAPWKIIGFSQGGYLAPFLGHMLGNVAQVIGIGCEYLGEELPQSLTFRIDGIHGMQDEIVPLREAESSHIKLLKSHQIQGKFFAIPDSGHRIDERVQTKVRDLLQT